MQPSRFLPAKRSPIAGLVVLCLALCLSLTGCNDSNSGGNNDNTGTLPADPSGDFATLPQTARFLTQATFGPTPTQLDTLTGVSASAWYRAELEKPATLVEPFLKDWETRLQVAAIYGGTFTPPGSDDNGSEMTDSVDQGADDEPEGTGDQGADGGEDDDESEAAAAEAAFDDFRDYVNHLNQAGFWNNALRGDDQLRQRVAFALSQILVVSDAAGEALNDFPGAMAYTRMF